MKQRIPTVLGAALVAAGCLAGTSAWADDTTPMTPSMKQGSDYGNPADKNQVVPSREQVQKDAAAPSSSTLDDNAQRQHDRDQGVTSGQGADQGMPADARANGESMPTPHQGMSAPDAVQGQSDASGTTWNWDQIDANHDNSVSPDEMNQWLQQHRSEPGSSSPSQPGTAPDSGSSGSSTQ